MTFTKAARPLHLLMLLLLAWTPAHADLQTGVAWLLQQAQADGSYTAAADIATPFQSSAETLRTFARIGTDDPGLPAARQFLAAAEFSGSEYLARRILAEPAASQAIIPWLEQLSTHRDREGGFGDRPGYAATVLDTAHALGALARADQAASAEAAVAWLLARQNTDGGWSDQPGGSSVPLTALALAALWHYRTLFALDTALDAAQAFLLAQRDGPLWGETFESALALIALLPRLPSAAALAETIEALRAGQDGDGSWGQDVYTTALALHALYLAEAAVTNPDLASLAGRVIDGDSGLPLSGVNAELTGAVSQSLSTASDGHFAFAGLPAGTYELTLSRTDYGSLSTRTTLTVGVHRDLGTLPLLKASGATTGSVYGTVTDAATGQPLEGVRVSTDRGHTTHSGADGGYQLSDLAPGPVILIAALPGYGEARGGATFDAGGFVVFSPALNTAQGEASALSGRILDAATALPLAGVSVALTGSTHASTLTDANGDYRIEPLTPGAVTITIALAGYDTVTAETIIYEKQQIAFSPTLYPSGGTPPGVNKAAVSGVILDSVTSEPMAGVQIEATVAGEVQIHTSGVDGRFRITDLTAPELSLRFIQDGYRPVAISLPLEPLSELDIGQIRLRPLDVQVLLPDLAVEALDAISVLNDPNALQLSGSLATAISNQGTRPVQTGFEVLAFYDSDTNERFDAGTDPVLGSVVVDTALAVSEEITLSIDVSGETPFRDAPISVWADSGSIVPEPLESNNFGSTADACLLPTTPGTLDPVLDWEWTGSSVLPQYDQVMSAPIVIPLMDTNGDNHTDEKDIPAIVFHTFRGSGYQGDGVLRAINGRDGTELWTVADPQYRTKPSASLAAADIDGDGYIEIIAPKSGNGLIAFEHDGTFKWETSEPANVGWGGASIADLDADGVAEIIIGNTALNADGSLRWQAYGYRGGSLSIVADIDLDGRPEIIAGPDAYDSEGQLIWRAPTGQDGYSAVGNFDIDPEAEIVVVNSLWGRVYLLDTNGSVIWGPVLVQGSGGGPPTIADMDGDEEPEIGVAGSAYYTVFETDGSILWQSPVQDVSSRTTGSSVFDFEGDGNAEVIYGDEHFLRIYQGTDGEILFEAANSTGTTHELPVIADVDNDGQANIVVCANDYAWGNQKGIRVFSARNKDWVDTRKIWNQHSYHITNINDDGSVPVQEAPSWLVHNTYRLNAFPDRDPRALADLSVGWPRLIDNGTGQPASLRVRVGNGGVAASAPTTLAFYEGDPDAGGQRLGSLPLDALAAGDWQDLQLDGIALTGPQAAFHVRVDPDDGLSECNEANNQVQTGLPAATLGRIQVATDAPDYPPETAVRLRATVRNAGALSGAFSARLRIEDAAGAPVAAFAPHNLGTLAGGDTRELTENWHTGRTLAGTYTLVGEVYDALGTLAHSDRANFRIIHPGGSAPAASLRTTTERPHYHTSDTVTIGNLARNLTASTLLEGVSLQVRLTDPAGQVIDTQTLALGQLPPGASRERRTTHALQDAPLGLYQARGELRDGAGTLLASDTTTFEVIQDPELVLSGEVTAQHPQRAIGEQQICTDRITNAGSLAIDGLPIRRLLTRLDVPAEITALTDQIALPAGATHTLVRTLETAALAAGDYACVLQARFEQDWTLLDADTFRLDGPSLAVTLGNGDRGRLLVLIAPRRGGCGCGCAHPLQDTAEQRAYLDALLQQDGWSYTLVERSVDFTRELRSGAYSAYALFLGDKRLDQGLQKQLREAVYRGEGLLLAGRHPGRQRALHAALGVRTPGNTRWARGLQLDPSALHPGGTDEFADWTKVASVQTRGAQAIGHFTVPAKPHGAAQPTGIAVTTHAYGQGTAVYAGLDLLAEATRAGGDNLYAELLLGALDALQPAGLRRADGAVVPLRLTLANAGPATAAAARLYPPARAEILDPGSAEPQADASLHWTIDLGANTTAERHLWVRLPAGSHDFLAEAGPAAEPFVATASDPLTLDIAAAPPLQALIDQAQMLRDHYGKKPYKAVLRDLRQAERWLARGRSDKAFKELLQATDALLDATTAEAQALRLGIDEQLWHLARTLADVASPPGGGGDDDDDDDDHGDDDDDDDDDECDDD